MRTRHVIPTLAFVAVLPLSACSSPAATTEERITYLRQVAQQGADTGNLLRAQEAPQIDKTRCGRAFDGLTRREDYPSDQTGGGVSKEWAAQIREFFVDSCVSGKAKATPGGTTTTTTTTTTTGPTTTTTTGPTTTTTPTMPTTGTTTTTTTTTTP
jgi:hypothetical protein